jgi:hypothetical protein
MRILSPFLQTAPVFGGGNAAIFLSFSSLALYSLTTFRAHTHGSI